MSERLAELAERQRRLQDRCASQRRALAHEIKAVEARFEPVDRVAGLARSTLLHPAVIGVALVGLLTLGRVRGLRLVGRALVLGAAARRLLRFARQF